jgi:DNA-binding transcriptional LysR family regulator
MLDVARLRVLDAVARNGSVTAAAQELNYSQSSVSHHLGRLEAETGAQPLQRVGRGIRPTPAGELLADRADAHPLETLELLCAGKVEPAIIFRYDETEPEAPGVRLQHLLDDDVYVLSKRRERGIAALRDVTRIAGCERCRSHLPALCADAGFEPRIGSTSDDMVVMHALMAAGPGVATQTGPALRAHGTVGVVASARSS